MMKARKKTRKITLSGSGNRLVVRKREKKDEKRGEKKDEEAVDRKSPEPEDVKPVDEHKEVKDDLKMEPSSSNGVDLENSDEKDDESIEDELLHEKTISEFSDFPSKDDLMAVDDNDKHMLGNDFRISNARLDNFKNFVQKIGEGERTPKPVSVTENSLLQPAQDFFLELGSTDVDPNVPKRLFFIDLERYTPWYQYYFYRKEHVNYVGFDHNGDPVFVSLEKKNKEKMKDDPDPVLRALIRTCKPYSKDCDDEWVFLPATSKSMKKALSKTRPALFSNMKLYRIDDHQFCKELLNLEQQLVFTQYKFGVLYVKDGQTEENDMFQNTETSPAFEEFLDFLGERITLQGWNSFRGGLDVKTNTTGTHAIYTKISNYEIMFHVSTMLPFNPDDPQQLERKRHIGNDVVVFVFKEGDIPFNPGIIRSEFNHIFSVIQPDKTKTGKTHYRVAFASKDGVHSYEPLLPYPSVFEKNDRFRDFLLTKAINSERAAMYAPSFVAKMSRTRKALFHEIAAKYLGSEYKEVSRLKEAHHHESSSGKGLNDALKAPVKGFFNLFKQ